MVVSVTKGVENLRIYNRSNAYQRSAIFISGSYIGSGTYAEYKITEGGATIQDWKRMGNASVMTNAYSGALLNVPTGSYQQWYSLQIRILGSDGITIVDSGTHAGNWTVGVLVGLAGQSMAYEWGSIGGGVSWDTGTSYVDVAGNWFHPANGAGAAKFCSVLQDILRIPVGVANVAVSGSSLNRRYNIGPGYWLPNGLGVTNIQNFARDIDRWSCLVWCQGETDAAQAEILDSLNYQTVGNYGSHMHTLLSLVDESMGNIWTYLIALGRCEIGTIANEEHASIRQLLAKSSWNRTKYVATHYDILHRAANSDIYHLEAAGYEELAARTAIQLAHHHFGLKAYGDISGPRIHNVLWSSKDPRTLRITLSGVRGGLRFKGGSPNLSCWILHNEDWTIKALPSAAAIENGSIRLTFAADVDPTERISYIHGTGQSAIWNSGGVEDRVSIPGTPIDGVPMQIESFPLGTKVIS